MRRLVINFCVATVFLLTLCILFMFMELPFLILWMVILLLFFVALPAFGLTWAELSQRLRSAEIREHKPKLYYLGIVLGIPHALLGLALVIAGFNLLITSIYSMFSHQPEYALWDSWYALLFSVALAFAGATCLIGSFRKERKKLSQSSALETPTTAPVTEQQATEDASLPSEGSEETIMMGDKDKAD